MGTDPDPGARGAATPAMGSFQLEDFAAGWIGGAASVIIGHPLDTVKTRLQAGVGYGNTLSCIRTVYRKESVFGFFKGMSFPLASIAVYNSVVFGVFSNTQRFLSQYQSSEPEASPPHTLSSLLLASMVAGVVSVGLGTPVDLIKIRLQMQTQPFRETNLSLKPRAVALGERPAYQGPVHCIAAVVRTEGLAGLYRGASAMLLRDVPGYCLYFIPYVFVSHWITPEADADPSPCAVWLAGGIAGPGLVSPEQGRIPRGCRARGLSGAREPQNKSLLSGWQALCSSPPGRATELPLWKDLCLICTGTW
ncbi:solute carrier family 25 member 48 isoform X6 [Pteronotus mesoamericanus]|uniref:solute carrier family 25 member 48 isoform X6 n=1 Tax=Pteronotus mesoamericanus TaxID=1884717 RepID=UPI0023EB6252|nr:solute carrier family 25 member 48 isoform X6 [Pteronotus parnellii mesoamericanus]